MVRFEMAGGKGKDLKKGLYGQDDIARGPLRWARTFAAFIGVADERQPQAGFFQMSGNIAGERASIVFGTEGVKTASVKGKTKRGTFNRVLKKIDQHKTAANASFRNLFPGLPQSNLRSIGARYLKAVPGKP